MPAEIPQATTADEVADKMVIAHILAECVCFFESDPHHMSDDLPVYLCIFSGCCRLHQSRSLAAAATAASRQRRPAAAEDEGESAKPRLTASVLAERTVLKGVGRNIRILFRA